MLNVLGGGDNRDVQKVFMLLAATRFQLLLFEGQIDAESKCLIVMNNNSFIPVIMFCLLFGY